MHDECNGSDVFGSDICTCRPYLIHGIEECARARAGRAALGIIVYNRKEGRALGEVTKFLVYNARKRQEGGDAAAAYFERTECVAGVQDARFQQLMPDVLHWLGLRRIDRFVSMSDMKHDALVGQGIEIVERVPIPDELVPADAHVEIAAKKAAGYYTPEPPKPRGPDRLGRAPARKVLSARPGFNRVADERRSAFVADAPGRARARASHAGDRPGGPAAAFPRRSRPPRRRGRPACSPRRATPIRRSTCRSIRAGGTSYADGDDRWAALRAADGMARPRDARARAEFDLAIVSVLLDAGAGPRWRYRDAAERRADRPLRGAGAREPCDVRRRRVLVRSGRSAAGRCRCAGAR